MKKIKNILDSLTLKFCIWIIGIIVILLFNYIKFDPTNFFRLLIPILLFSSFALLGVFAFPDIRKSIKEHYHRGTKNILNDIEGMRKRQEYENLEKQINTDQEILNLRESLRGFRRDYFERCVIYSAILFAIALLSTFTDFGSYIEIPNLVVIIFFFFWGLFYFSKMIHSIFIALNIIKLDK